MPQSDASLRLAEQLGFDPTKQPAGSADLLAEVVQEIQAERVAKARNKIKEVLLKAMELKTQHEKVRKDFEKESQRFEKELGKTLGELERMATGKTSPEPQVNESPAEEEKTDG